MTFRAFLLTKSDDAPAPAIEWADVDDADLMDGDVTVSVSHSCLNYKDGLAVTGKAPVVRRWPMIPGIDFAGTVTASSHPEVAVGDEVVLNGWGVGETHLGGWSEVARVKGDWLVPKPKAFTPEQTMAIGTAGYTAMLCVLAIERNGVTPDAGPVLVTGASGGVGSVAVALLAKAGFEVHASTGRTEEEAYLRELGASTIVPRDELSGAPRALNKERWAGAVDTVGSTTLANVCSMTRYRGTVAACGNAGGLDFPSSVAPFILRGVTLAGVDSVMAPKAERLEAWERLATDLDPAALAAVTAVHPIADAPDLATKIVEGQVRGRVVFEIS